MNRRGIALPALLLVSGAVAMLAFTIAGDAAQRARLAQQHQVRIQGREWCLGARALPPGTRLEVGGWQVAVDAGRAVSARSEHGVYRIAADGSESWSRKP